MKVGFHTNSFVWAGVDDIGNIARFAHKNRFDFLEVGPGIELDQKAFSRFSDLVEYDAFIYCRNFIDDDAHVAEQERDELFRRMEFASLVGAKRMICSTGISLVRSLKSSGGCDPLKSLDVAVEFLEVALEKAYSLGIELCLENCPMYRNIATSPYMWRKIFDRVPSDILNICYDASHFVWQMIDVYQPIIEFGNRIRHVHVKDTSIDQDKLNDVGILHNTGSEMGFEENQWWRHSLMGDGRIDWGSFFNLVKDVCNEPHLSFEMEDYRYEAVPEKVEMGLAIQRERLDEFI